METFNLVVEFLNKIPPAIVAAVACLWVSYQLKDLRKDMDNNFKSMKIWLSSLMTILRRKDGIEEADREMLARMLDFKIEAAGNPISEEEARRLQAHVNRAVKREVFTPEDATDFKNLAEKYVQDPEVQRKVDNDKLAALLYFARDTWARSLAQPK